MNGTYSIALEDGPSLLSGGLHLGIGNYQGKVFLPRVRRSQAVNEGGPILPKYSIVPRYDPFPNTKVSLVGIPFIEP